MELTQTQCCAIEEISELSTHATPEDAMADLCEAMEYGAADSYNDREYRNRESNDDDLIIPGLLTFTGVVGYTDGDTDDTTYGPKFAAYIRKHKLGRVVEGPVSTNRMNHPTHKVRLWIWKPSVKGLTKWWKANRPERIVKDPYKPIISYYAGW